MPSKWVYIRWIDSSSPNDSEWHSPDELYLKGVECDTVGILVYEDDDIVTVASCQLETGFVYGVITIPKCSILKRRRVK